MSDRIRWFLKSLLPKYWFQLNPYSREWDKKLNELLDTEHFTDVTHHDAKIGGIKVWIANHAYGSFRPADMLPDMRPRRRTIVRAWEQLLRDAFRSADKLS